MDEKKTRKPNQTQNPRSTRRKNRYDHSSSLLDRTVLEAQTAPKPVKIPPRLGGCPCTLYTPTMAPFSFELNKPQFRYVRPAPVSFNRYNSSYYPPIDTLDRHRYTGNYRSLVDEKVLEARTNKISSSLNKPCYLPPSYRYYPSTCCGRSNPCCESPSERLYNLEKFYEEAKRYGHERKYKYTPCIPTQQVKSNARPSYRPLSTLCAPSDETLREPPSYTEQEDGEFDSTMSEENSHNDGLDTPEYEYPFYIEKVEPASHEASIVKTENPATVTVIIKTPEPAGASKTEHTNLKDPPTRNETNKTSNVKVEQEAPVEAPGDVTDKTTGQTEENKRETTENNTDKKEAKVEKTITVQIGNARANPVDEMDRRQEPYEEETKSQAPGDTNNKDDEAENSVQEIYTVEIGKPAGSTAEKIRDVTEPKEENVKNIPNGPSNPGEAPVEHTVKVEINKTAKATTDKIETIPIKSDEKGEDGKKAIEETAIEDPNKSNAQGKTTVKVEINKTAEAKPTDKIEESPLKSDKKGEDSTRAIEETAEEATNQSNAQGETTVVVEINKTAEAKPTDKIEESPLKSDEKGEDGTKADEQKVTEAPNKSDAQEETTIKVEISKTAEAKPTDKIEESPTKSDTKAVEETVTEALNKLDSQEETTVEHTVKVEINKTDESKPTEKLEERLTKSLEYIPAPNETITNTNNSPQTAGGGTTVTVTEVTKGKDVGNDPKPSDQTK